jgi:transposase
LTLQAGALEAKIRAWHRANEQSRRLETIPGIGHLSASAIVANVPNPHQFKNGRNFAAWLGLVPRQNSSGGKSQLFGITKRGNVYLRRLLVSGARSALLHYKRRDAIIGKHVGRLASRKPFLVVAVALANRMARVAWALLMSGEPYRDLGSA